MIIIVVFLIVCTVSVGFFEWLEWRDPSRDHRRQRRSDAARLDALERAVFDQETGSTTRSAYNEPPGTII